jgi:cytochrome c-type biogenesis protein CcmH/NrfG
MQEAEEVLQQGIAACPSSPRIHSYLGERMFRRKQPKAAERLFAEAVRLKPSYVEAIVGLAAAQRKLAVGNPNYLDKAVANNLLALAHDPDNESAYLGLGFCYLNLKKWEDAATAFAHVTRCKPDMAAGWFLPRPGI